MSILYKHFAQGRVDICTATEPLDCFSRVGSDNVNAEQIPGWGRIDLWGDAKLFTVTNVMPFLLSVDPHRHSAHIIISSNKIVFPYCSS